MNFLESPAHILLGFKCHLMFFKKTILNVINVVVIVVSVQSQQNVDLDSLAVRFMKYVRSGNKEKIIVLTDKEFYTTGETIWLKAWCLDSLSNHFIRKSKN